MRRGEGERGRKRGLDWVERGVTGGIKSRDKEEEAWGSRLAAWNVGSWQLGWGGGGSALLLHALQYPDTRSSRGLQTYWTSKQWTSCSAATDGPEMDLVEVWSSSTWSPRDLACARVGDGKKMEEGKAILDGRRVIGDGRRELS